MKKIINQLPDNKIDDIFTECNTFADKAIEEVISKNKNVILNESKQYSQYVPNNLSSYSLTVFPPNEVEEIKKLYTQKMVKHNSGGRKYYDILMSNASICPICGFGTPTELDHFIPKSLYPQLCITPSNLIPICRDCNKNKDDAFSKNYMDLPFHPYFDDMNEQWLECNIIFKSAKIINYCFYCGLPSAPLFVKYNSFLSTFQLNKTFSGPCCREIEDIKFLHKALLLKSEQVLMEDIQTHKESFQKNDVNSWKSALYRALIRQFDEYCAFLRTI